MSKEENISTAAAAAGDDDDGGGGGGGAAAPSEMDELQAFVSDFWNKASQSDDGRGCARVCVKMLDNPEEISETIRTAAITFLATAVCVCFELEGHGFDVSDLDDYRREPVEACLERHVRDAQGIREQLRTVLSNHGQTGLLGALADRILEALGGGGAVGGVVIGAHRGARRGLPMEQRRQLHGLAMEGRSVQDPSASAGASGKKFPDLAPGALVTVKVELQTQDGYKILEGTKATVSSQFGTYTGNDNRKCYTCIDQSGRKFRAYSDDLEIDVGGAALGAGTVFALGGGGGGGTASSEIELLLERLQSLAIGLPQLAVDKFLRVLGGGGAVGGAVEVPRGLPMEQRRQLDGHAMEGRSVQDQIDEIFRNAQHVGWDRVITALTFFGGAETDVDKAYLRLRLAEARLNAAEARGATGAELERFLEGVNLSKQDLLAARARVSMHQAADQGEYVVLLPAARADAAIVEVYLLQAKAKHFQDAAKEIFQQWTVDGPNFIFVDAPSGTGKTQTAFAFDDALRLPFVNTGTSSQSVNRAFGHFGTALVQAVARDVANHDMDALSTVSLSVGQMRDRFWTMGLLYHLLSQTEDKSTEDITRHLMYCDLTAIIRPMTIRELADFEGRVVVFDELVREPKFIKFLRNACFLARLRVVLMGTNSSASNLIDVADDSRADGTPIFWCRVFCRLAPFTPSTVTTSSRATLDQTALLNTLPDVLQFAIAGSNPLFATVALEIISQMKTEEMTAQSIWRELREKCPPLIIARKAQFRESWLAGQLSMQLDKCIEKSDASKSASGSKGIIAHFAHLVDPCPTVTPKGIVTTFFDVMVGGKEKQTRTGARWTPLCIFPSPATDPLMHVILGGSAAHPALQFQAECRLSVAAALAEGAIRDAFYGTEGRTGNTNAVHLNGDDLEAVVAVSMISASRQGQLFEGVAFGRFLADLCGEFCLASNRFGLIWDEASANVLATIPNIPYLQAAPGTKSLVDLGIGELHRARNGEMLDLNITTRNRETFMVSGEAKNYTAPLDASVVMQRLHRMKAKMIDAAGKSEAIPAVDDDTSACGLSVAAETVVGVKRGGCSSSGANKQPRLKNCGAKKERVDSEESYSRPLPVDGSRKVEILFTNKCTEILEKESPSKQIFQEHYKDVASVYVVQFDEIQKQWQLVCKNPGNRPPATPRMILFIIPTQSLARPLLWRHKVF